MTKPAKTPWAEDPLGYLIAPHGAKTFFDKHYERSALIVRRDEPHRYDGLLSLARIDEIIAGIDLSEAHLDMARADPPVRREDFIFASGVADRGAVARHYQQGATIILPQLHSQDARLKSFTRALESVLSAHVQTNIYLTPPNSQGFRTHYDDHDVFVIQVHGEKAWRLYDTPVENPYRGEGFQPGEHPVGEPVEQFVLKAGDMAYVPRGLMHDASTSGAGPSLHITVGIIVKTWADLMLEAVSEVALREPGFRRSLPPGHARADYDRAESEQYFKGLLETLSREASLDGAMDLFIDNFIRSRLPESSNAIKGFDAPDRPGARFRLRPFTPWRLAGDGDKLVLVAPGGELPFPAAAEAGLDQVLEGKTIDISAFSALPEDEAKEVLKTLFAYGVVEAA
ncbi:MAG: hypothetical protein KIS81_10940 [Maricaulaceae bacterium]|nr:hypothetical protein [Maricaulaceae bacterium]